MDKELLNLCKEVYEKTGFGDGSDINRVEWHDYYDDWSVPLYTSDYLLEKLPQRTDDIRDTAMLGRATNNNGWSIVYRDMAYLADTPLKALLKLIIALSDEELK